MRFRWSDVLALIWAIGLPRLGAAQQVREIGIHAVATSSNPALLVGGPYAGLRISARTRVSATFGIGVSDDEFAWRGEALGHFLLSPAKRSGWGAYLAGGLAVVGGPVDRGYLVVTLGAEERPGGRSGWFAEAGVGGGVRLAAGYRWRKPRESPQ
jgi:hypothetical protein